MPSPSSLLQDEFDDLHGDFLDESRRLLDRLSENLLFLDEWVRQHAELAPQRCNDELMNDMFRAAHSIKGLSAMLGLSDVNQLTHKIENLFDAARTSKLYFNSAMVELLFQSLDALTHHIDRVGDATLPRIDDSEVLDRIQHALHHAGAEHAASQQSDAESVLLAAMEEMQFLTDSCGSQAHASQAHASQAHASQAHASQGNMAPSTSPPAPCAEFLPTSEANSIDLGTVADEAQLPAAPASAAVAPFEDVVDEVEVPPKYLAIFIDEAEQSVDTLAETLLVLEYDWQPELAERLLLVSHRLKGSSASIGLNRCAKLAHAMEDVLQALRESGAIPPPDLTEAFLHCTDALRAYIAGFRTGEMNSRDFPAALAMLQSAAARNEVPCETSAQLAVDQRMATEAASDANDQALTSCLATAVESTPAWRHSISELAPRGQSCTAGRVTFAPNLPMAGLKALLLCEKLHSLGAVFHSHPAANELASWQTLEAWSFGLAASSVEDAIRAQFRIAGVASIELVAITPEAANAAQPLTARPEPSASPRITQLLAESPAVCASQPTLSAAAPSKFQTRPTAESAENHPRRPTTGHEASLPSSPPTRPAPAANSASPMLNATKPTSAPNHPPAAIAAPRPDANGADGRSAKPTETLRVDIERLDHLMNLAGQLVISKARFSQINDGLRGLTSRKTKQSFGKVHASLRKISTAAADSHCPAESLQEVQTQVRRLQWELQNAEREMQKLFAARSMVLDLGEAVHQLERISDGFQHSIMETRMVPIGPLFSRFRRVVRDITRSTGKDIRLDIFGEKTELDKRMIDELGDPLIHMVRNSADHGIEPPSVRLAAGKPTQGTVTLDAFHRGNSIWIQVKDDGRGLDEEKIRAKAVQRGLLTQADAERLTSHQAFQLIWEPGFSTATEVTEISGRGMGMDIVRSKIEELNGSVELESQLGVGTVFTIRLPLTLAILPSLLSRIDGETYALPMETVREIVRRRADELFSVHGRLTTRVRDRMVSVVDLRELFAWNGPGDISAEAGKDRTLVVIGEPGREVGLIVDRLLGEDDVVIKSIAENYRNVPGIAGASILGDGRVSLILDVDALVEMASTQAAAESI